MGGVTPVKIDAHQPALLEQVRHTIRLRHYSIRTEEAYTNWIKRYILFHDKKHPAEMGENEINQFLTHLRILPVDLMIGC